MKLSEVDDTVLIDLMSGSNAQHVMNEIYRRYWRKLFSIAYNHLRNKEDAEEIVQDVLISLWKRRDNLTISALPNYLATAIKFKVFTHIKKKNKVQLKLEDHDLAKLDIADNEHDKIYAIFVQQQFKGLIDTLPAKCKLVFTYSREEGKSIPDIAKTLNIAEKTVEAHLTKALKTLRISMKHIGLSILFGFWFFF